MQLPLNAEGGDDQDQMAAFWAALLRSADERGLDHDEFYFIKDEMMHWFGEVQERPDMFPTAQGLGISRLRVAAWIWQDMPSSTYRALLKAVLP
jgi:hypothetical protein